MLLCWLAGLPAFAGETNLTLTIGKDVYSNVVFGTVSPSSVSSRHSSGSASISLAKLPPELQQRFGYDPKRAAEYQQAVQVQRQNVAAQEAASKQAKQVAQAEAEKRVEGCKEAQCIGGTILQVLKDGVLIYQGGTRALLRGFPFPNAAEGNEVKHCWAYRDGTYTYQDVNGTSRTVEQWVYCEPVTKWKPGTEGTMWPVR